MGRQLRSFVVAAAAACLAAGSLAAQSPAPQAKPAPANRANPVNPVNPVNRVNPANYAPPRTADGHPDLTGVYDAATMTPIERPAEYSGRLVLTPAEAASVEQHQQQRTVAA